MSDKMTIEKARDIYAGENVGEPYYERASGFVAGYESRDAEIEELKKEIKMHNKIFKRYAIKPDLVQKIMMQEESK